MNWKLTSTLDLNLLYEEDGYEAAIYEAEGF